MSDNWQFYTAIGASIIRHCLTGFAGALVANGLISSNQTDAFVSIGSSIVLGGVAFAWSWWQKNGYVKLKSIVAGYQSGQSAQKRNGQ